MTPFVEVGLVARMEGRHVDMTAIGTDRQATRRIREGDDDGQGRSAIRRARIGHVEDPGIIAPHTLGGVFGIARPRDARDGSCLLYTSEAADE